MDPFFLIWVCRECVHMYFQFSGQNGLVGEGERFPSHFAQPRLACFPPQMPHPRPRGKAKRLPWVLAPVVRRGLLTWLHRHTQLRQDASLRNIVRSVNKLVYRVRGVIDLSALA
jgi:hypothetical protein